MKTLNLDNLLKDLEKQAGIEKEASVAKPNISKGLTDILEKKASEDITADAVAAGESLAREFLTKLAVEVTEPAKEITKEAAENEIQVGNAAIVADDDKKIEANKGAAGTGTTGSIDAPLVGTVEAGLARGAKSDDIVDELEDKKVVKSAEQTNTENSEMAKNIMQKIAQLTGEATTTPAAAVNTAAAAAPNLIQSTNETMTAADDKKVLPLPGADGSLNSILEAVVARAEDQGAVSDDLVNGDRPASSAAGDDEVEKAAAVSALVDAGCDFESAVDMVKQAEEALLAEADQQEKVAAVKELCAAGYDFETAVDLVKQAEAELASQGKGMEKAATLKEFMDQGHDFDAAVDLVKKASAAPAKKEGLTKSAEERAVEKKAAFEALIEAGVDFDQAIEMVKQAEIDVYGEE